MRKKSTIKLVAILLITAVLGFISFNGFSAGIYDFQPLPKLIKQGLDLTGGVSVVYEVKNEQEATEENLQTVMAVFRTRLDAEGYTEATISPQGSKRLRIEIPINKTSGDVDPNEVTKYLVSTAKVSFVDPEQKIVFEGKDMDEVGVTMTEQKEYAVAFKLNAEATKKFAEATTKYNGQAISIKLDEEIISAPVVNDVIATGSGVISGNFTYESASRLANQIRSGVMPIELEELEVRSISATLGDEALQKGIIAGIIGMALVMLLLLLVYRMSGLVANIALAMYIIIVVFCMATIPGVQLTLPGIAGIILAIGMAVDANVIIFERINEEIKDGKNMVSASQAGFSRAFSAIIDGNITTIIAAIVLLYFGTGTIKGFGITLLIGIVASFFTSVFITRAMLKIFVGINSNPALYTRVKFEKEGGKN